MKRLIYSLALILAGCTFSPQNEGQQPKQTVLIFHNAPNQSMTDRAFGLNRYPEGTLIYVDTLLRRIHYVPRTLGYDTLVVPAPYGYTEVQHRNQAIEEISYLLLAGDTVLFTYGPTMRPRLRSLISDENTWLYNLLWSDTRAVQPNGYSTATVLTEPTFRRADWLIKKRVNKYGTEIIDKARRYYIDLDSLRPVYEAYRSGLLFRLDSLAAAEHIPDVYARYYKGILLGDLHPFDRSSYSDSLAHYLSYWNNIRIDLFQQTSRGRSTEHFDVIAADTVISMRVKKAMLYEQMASIEVGDYWRPYPAEMVERYRARYRELTGDSTSFFPSTVNKENLLPEGYSNDLILEGLDGEQVAFEQVLRNHRGKVIYVDLWASWCAPCRAGMPDAKRLREAYKGRDVVFLYLAVNDTGPAWRSAVKSCHTDYLGENYRVLNGDDCLFLREIKHTKIPHMLLYDRTGKLVDTDAPRPGEDMITMQLDKLL